MTNDTAFLGERGEGAVGSVIINFENFGAWFGSQEEKASQNNPPAPPPPPPFTAHTQVCQDVIAGRKQARSLADFRLANFAGHDISDIKCNRGWQTNEWNEQTWKALKYVSARLRDEPALVQRAIAADWRALEFAGPARRADLAILEAAFEQARPRPRALWAGRLGSKGRLHPAGCSWKLPAAPSVPREHSCLARPT